MSPPSLNMHHSLYYPTYSLLHISCTSLPDNSDIYFPFITAHNSISPPNVTFWASLLGGWVSPWPTPGYAQVIVVLHRRWIGYIYKWGLRKLKAPELFNRNTESCFSCMFFFVFLIKQSRRFISHSYLCCSFWRPCYYLLRLFFSVAKSVFQVEHKTFGHVFQNYQPPSGLQVNFLSPTYSNKQNKYKHKTQSQGDKGRLWQVHCYLLCDMENLVPCTELQGWVWETCFCFETWITHHHFGSSFTVIFSKGWDYFFNFAFPAFIFFLQYMDQSKSRCPHIGLIQLIHPPRDYWCLLITAWWLVLIPCPRPRVEGSAGHKGRSYGHTVDPTLLIRWGTSGGRTAAAAGWADWPADAPPPAPLLSVSWRKTRD